MTVISRIKTWNTSDTLTAADLNAEFNNIVNDYNGSISNANVAANAAIDASKLDSTLLTTTNTKTVSNKTLTSPTITGTVTDSSTAARTGTNTFGKTVQTITTATDQATVTFDLALGNIHKVILGDNRILAISNETAGQCFVIELVQDGTGSRTVTWFSTIAWAGGVTPTLTTTLNKTDVFGFICTATDTYQGFIIGQNI